MLVSNKACENQVKACFEEERNKEKEKLRNIINLILTEEFDIKIDTTVADRLVDAGIVSVNPVPLAIGDVVYYVDRRGYISEWTVYVINTQVAVRPKTEDDPTPVLCKDWSVIAMRNDGDGEPGEFTKYMYGDTFFSDKKHAEKKARERRP